MSNARIVIRALLLIGAISLCSGCAVIPGGRGYSGPPERPATLKSYYAVQESYRDFADEILVEGEEYQVRRIYLDTYLGPVTVDYFQRPKPGKQLILIFPILGGSNVFENYMAHYFAEGGFDAAVVHRDNDFKRPENYDRLEELLRANVVKDRIVLDFFEKEFGKEEFGSFGISRGAINAAASAGVDPRFKYNVLVMGGADLINIFRHSNEPGVRRYRKRVMKAKGISREEFFRHLQETVKTDPKMLAQYIDARNTLMFLSVFDKAVPIKYGMELKRLIGEPRTVYLMSGHYTTVLYTQFVKLALPMDNLCLFPLDYLETESLAFFRQSFGKPRYDVGHLFYTMIQSPIRLVAGLVDLFTPAPPPARPETPLTPPSGQILYTAHAER